MWNHKISMLLAIILISFMTTGMISKVSNAGSNAIQVIDALWGIPGNIVAVGPGDKGVTLSLVLQNSGSDLISGVNVYLKLRPPFTNLTGGYVAKSYLPISLQPGQSSSAQFLLNVDDNASIGRYQFDAQISYMAVQQLAESKSTSASNTDQTSSSSSTTTGSQFSKTSTPPENTTSSSTSATSQSSTSGTKQQSSSSSSSYTDFSVNKLENNMSLQIWLTGKVVLDVSTGIDFISAGKSSTLPIEIINKGSADASSVTVALSIPTSGLGQTATASSSPLILIGNDNQWYAQTIPAGGRLLINPRVFASQSAIDNTLQLQVTISYKDNVGIPKTDSRNIGVLVKGSIVTVLQDLILAPSIVGAGGNITVSGTVLNEGDVSALYMNASLQAEPPFTAYDGASTYIGEVAPNTPIPFSLNIGIARDTENGTYVLPLIMYYQDSYGQTYMIDEPLTVIVQGEANSATPQPSESPRGFLLLTYLLSIVIVAGMSILGTYLIMRRRRTNPTRE